jgi:acyl carrier protein
MDELQQIRNYILKNLLFSEDDASLSNSVSLIATGVIDSTGVLELIMFIEETFHIVVSEEEMIPENLESVEKIADYVRRKGLNKG